MPNKCEFDGIQKTITPLSQYSSIDVKTDIYSAWKSWVLDANNMSFPAAIRVIGGDQIGPGLFAGDTYFLMNGWKVIVSHRLIVNGVLYDDSGTDPFIISAGGSVRSVVSNLVQSVSTSGSGAVDYDAIANAVVSKIDSVSDMIVILNEIKTKVSSLNAEKHDEILQELVKINSMIDDTQAFILSS